MKKFLMVMGALFCVLIVLFVIGITLLAIRGTRLDQESRAYANAAIPAIVTDWNEDAFFERASPELEKVVSARDGDRLFATFRKLGHVVHCDPAKGQAHMTAILGQPRTITASYEADARFEKGEARIFLDLIKHDDRWQILGFHINSAALIPK